MASRALRPPGIVRGLDGGSSPCETDPAVCPADKREGAASGYGFPLRFDKTLNPPRGPSKNFYIPFAACLLGPFVNQFGAGEGVENFASGRPGPRLYYPPQGRICHTQEVAGEAGEQSPLRHAMTRTSYDV